MKFSVVIPTYNEENDIAITLDSLVSLNYPDVEIIVVDDSTDSTPNIVSQYAEQGVRLIQPEKRGGRCEARNRGIHESNGEVVIILNADVLLPKEFINQIKVHYDAGYDYVLVKSEVVNDSDLFARYVDSVAESDHSTDPQWMEWTEGFSCRKDVMLKTRLFPTGFSVPICAGEDGFFGNELRKAGAKKKIDFNIVVTHISPASFAEYWYIRKGRGRGCPQIRRFLERWSLKKIKLWASLRIIYNLVQIITIIPVLYKNFIYTRYSNKKIRDFVPFIYSWLIEQFAFHVGEWESIFEIQKSENKS